MKSSCRMSTKDPDPHYCYCNATGQRNTNMLQCSKCKSWYHEDCVQCLNRPMLSGDHFYVFICSICNQGSEYLARIELKWVDIVHLALYNLTMEHKRKYFDLEDSIMLFLEINWTRLQLVGNLKNVLGVARKSHILYVLLHNEKRFKCGKEIRKKNSLWGLRELVPPKAPSIEPLLLQTEDCLTWNIKVPQRIFKVLCGNKKYVVKPKVKSPSQTNDLNGSRNYPSRNLRAVNCQSAPVAKELKKIEISKVKKPRLPFKEGENGTSDLLDILIPPPISFKCSNNPFARTVKQTVKTTKISVEKIGANIYRIGQSMIECHGSHVVRCRKSRSRKRKANNTMKEDETSAPGPSLSADNTLNPSNYEHSSIVGKRVCKNGKTEYLVQREAEDVEDST